MSPTIWSKSHPAWGQRRRTQRNLYALRVSAIMAGMAGTCPSCLGPLGEKPEVDRAIPTDDYTPGNCAYICHGCNHGRGILQSVGMDWARANDYARDVRAASVHVAIPTEAEAMAWHRGKGDAGTVSRYA